MDLKIQSTKLVKECTFQDIRQNKFKIKWQIVCIRNRINCLVGLQWDEQIKPKRILVCSGVTVRTGIQEWGDEDNINSRLY